jgi:hypothetical protein
VRCCHRVRRMPRPENRRQRTTALVSVRAKCSKSLAFDDGRFLIHDAAGDHLLVKVDADQVRCRATGLRKRRNWNDTSNFPHAQKPATRRVDLPPPITSPIAAKTRRTNSTMSGKRDERTRLLQKRDERTQRFRAKRDERTQRLLRKRDERTHALRRRRARKPDLRESDRAECDDRTLARRHCCSFSRLLRHRSTLASSQVT